MRGTHREKAPRCIVHDAMASTPPRCWIRGGHRSPLRIRPDYGIHATMSQNGFRNITLHQMEALIRLLETGSFTHAAERMALSQPTLTKHIRNLEDAVGARVVDRKNRGVSLTPEGRILYDYARRIARLREDAQEKIAPTSRCWPKAGLSSRNTLR